MNAIKTSKAHNMKKNMNAIGAAKPMTSSTAFKLAAINKDSLKGVMATLFLNLVQKVTVSLSYTPLSHLYKTCSLFQKE